MAVLLLLVFFTTLSAHVVHIDSRYIDVSHDDERFTLGEGLEHLNPFGKPNERFEVGETTRWFVRLLYPVGLFYGNSHKGVGRPAHRENFMDELQGGQVYAYKYPSLVAANPVVQDYAFSMRVAFGLLAVASFCLVLWVLFNPVNPAAAAAYGALVLVSDLVLIQFRLFYTETTLFILFNLAVFLCFSRDMPYRKVAYAGILAAALSVKLTGAIIAASLFAYVAFNMRGRAKLRIELFLLCFAASMLLINVNAVSLHDFINDTLWNVLHYSLGDYRVAGGGTEFFRRRGAGAS